MSKMSFQLLVMGKVKSRYMSYILLLILIKLSLLVKHFELQLTIFKNFILEEVERRDWCLHTDRQKHAYTKTQAHTHTDTDTFFQVFPWEIKGSFTSLHLFHFISFHRDLPNHLKNAWCFVTHGSLLWPALRCIIFWGRK